MRRRPAARACDRRCRMQPKAARSKAQGRRTHPGGGEPSHRSRGESRQHGLLVGERIGGGVVQQGSYPITFSRFAFGEEPAGIQSKVLIAAYGGQCGGDSPGDRIGAGGGLRGAGGVRATGQCSVVGSHRIRCCRGTPSPKPCLASGLGTSRWPLEVFGPEAAACVRFG